MKRLLLTLLLGTVFISTSIAGTIKDGKGRGFEAEVNKEQQLVVAAVTETSLEHESEENSQAFSWSSDSVNPAIDDTVLLLKNTSDTNLHIEYAIISGSTTSEYTIHLPTTEVTPTGGTTVTGTNLNTGGKTEVADAIATSLETNNSQGNVIGSPFILADTTYLFPLPGVILGKNKSIGVDVVANTTLSAVTIVGHYED